MAQIAKLARRKLGEILVDEGVLREDQVQEALRRQRVTGELFGEALVQLGYLTEMDIARTIVRQFGLPYMDASRYRIPKEAVQLVPPDLMLQNQFVVLDRIGKILIVAVAGVLSADVLEKLEKIVQGQVFVYVSTSSQVQAALAKVLPQNKAAAPAGKK
jgi:hypothetical protein